jgi:hypothetical protein
MGLSITNAATLFLLCFTHYIYIYIIEIKLYFDRCNCVYNNIEGTTVSLWAGKLSKTQMTYSFDTQQMLMLVVVVLVVIIIMEG